MADTSEIDNDQRDWRWDYSVLMHKYMEKCRDYVEKCGELDRLLSDSKALTWLERLVCGVVGMLLTVAVASFSLYGTQQAEKDLVRALEAYCNAANAESVRHWFKTIGH